ncbi:MAG: hypothetical protein H6731_10920 [Myxococcales bacterium]|nr:MAG: hypothetical protein H6731_10920 [Myxococcales bacterium]
MKFVLFILFCATCFSHNSDGIVNHMENSYPSYGEWGIDTAGMDTDIHPGDDFYGYVNGKWNQNTQIPSDETRFGSFNIVDRISDMRVKDIVEAWTDPKTPLDPEKLKVVSLYQSYLNEEKLEELDILPIRAYLEELKQIQSKENLVATMARSMADFGKTFFNLRGCKKNQFGNSGSINVAVTKV